MKASRVWALSLLATVGACVSGMLGSACKVDAGKYEVLSCPPSSREVFQVVSTVLERRCGTLDCHGTQGRALRIYGQYGLRRPEPEGSPNVQSYDDYYTGGQEPTTDAELADNAASVCALEPEKMALVRDGEDEPESLTLMRKAILAEKHKGGPVWNPGNAGFRCLVSWLTYSDAPDGGSPIDEKACLEEIAKP